MRKVLLLALGVVGVFAVGFAVVVAMQPAEFHIERSATIHAPAAVVFANVNDFHRWESWSPWAKLDPAAKFSFEGPSAGKGAVFAWSGNNDVGEGSMTILESQPNERIRIKLDFVRPFEDTCTVLFTFKSSGTQTEVMWNMTGQQGFIHKAICLFMDKDKMIGGDLDRGLAKLKAVVEEENKR